MTPKGTYIDTEIWLLIKTKAETSWTASPLIFTTTITQCWDYSLQKSVKIRIQNKGNKTFPKGGTRSRRFRSGSASASRAWWSSRSIEPLTAITKIDRLKVIVEVFLREGKDFSDAKKLAGRPPNLKYLSPHQSQYIAPRLRSKALDFWSFTSRTW